MNTTFLRSILTTLLLVASVASWAYDVKVDGFYYNLNSEAKTAEETTSNITSIYTYSGSVSIPETFVSGGVTYSVKSIGEWAFSKCLSLTSVTIPNSVTSIGSYAFYYSFNLTSVTIGNSVTSIGGYAFSSCSALTSVTIGNSVKSIEAQAFSGCTGMTSVTIPNSVTSIGNYAFGGCSGLTSVTIPNSVTSIESEAFSSCSALTSVSVESGNTVYDSRDNCNAIIETKSNTLIAGCKSTVIPNSVKSIGNYAFGGCSGLTSVTIPNSVKSIGIYAFGGCSGLTSVTIPNSVKSIGNYAFSSCTGLTSVKIGNSVKSIGEWAFRRCTSLTSVYNYATTPQTLSSSDDFSNAANCTLYVPAASIEAYKAANYWKDFKEILAIEDAPTAINNLNSDNTKPSYQYYDLSGCKFSAPQKGLNIVNGKKVIL